MLAQSVNDQVMILLSVHSLSIRHVVLRLFFHTSYEPFASSIAKAMPDFLHSGGVVITQLYIQRCSSTLKRKADV